MHTLVEVDTQHISTVIFYLCNLTLSQQFRLNCYSTSVAPYLFTRGITLLLNCLAFLNWAVLNLHTTSHACTLLIATTAMSVPSLFQYHNQTVSDHPLEAVQNAWHAWYGSLAFTYLSRTVLHDRAEPVWHGLFAVV